MRRKPQSVVLILCASLLSELPAMAADNAYDNAADAAYSQGWFFGSNGGHGFGPWGFAANGDYSQFTIASSPGIDVSNKSWALTVLTTSYLGAYRTFAGGNLSPGQVLRFSWTSPGTNAWDSNILLEDSVGNRLVFLSWTSGSFNLSTNNVWATSTAAPWSTSGSSATASFSLTDDGNMVIKIASGTNSVVFDGVPITNGISAVVLCTSGPIDTNLPGKVSYFNELTVADQARIPMMNPAGGPLTNGQLVSISTATPGASIRYTLDGSEPSPTNGLVYGAPLLLNPRWPIRVNALAYKAGLADSPVARTTYTPPPAPPPLGMAVGNNLSQVDDWDIGSWPFVDVFKNAGPWITYNDNDHYWDVWDTGFGPMIPVDTNGWPTQVPFSVTNSDTPQIVHTAIGTLTEPGTYNFIYEGSGDLHVWFVPGATGDALTNGHAYLTATGGVQSFSFTTTNRTSALVEIHRSAANDYLRNFHLVLTNFLSTYQTQPFHPLFLQRLQPFQCVRFIEWARADEQWDLTTTNARTSWTNRTTPSYYTQAADAGVALEYMVQLCNTLQRDAWICIPHAADDDYIRQAARLLRDNLSPNLRIYVEYSNETWNFSFTQEQYVQAMGVSLNLDPAPYTAGQMFVAMRCAQIWDIFQQVFGSASRSRLVKVMATWCGSPWTTQTRLAAMLDTNLNPTGVLPDALAIAPYFGTMFTPSDLPPNAPYPTVDDILTNLSVQGIADQKAQVIAQKAIADAYALPLICYEGGQIFVGIYGAENDTNLTAIVTAANRDPRMFDRYTEYLNMLKAQGVALVNNLAYCGNWSKYGCWGALEYQDQPTNSAPKYEALVEWIAAHPVPAFPIMLTPAVTTNGAAGFVFTNNHDASFTVLTTTNLAFPLADWTVLGAPAETAPGTYQLTPSITTNESQRFYGVRSP